MLEEGEIKKEKGVTCCGLLEKLEKEGETLNRPMVIDRESGNITTKDWAIWLFKMTPAGNLSRVGHAQVFLNFCPFCGMEIRP